jgi:hypothetical protein
MSIPSAFWQALAANLRTNAIAEWQQLHERLRIVPHLVKVDEVLQFCKTQIIDLEHLGVLDKVLPFSGTFAYFPRGTAQSLSTLLRFLFESSCTFEEYHRVPHYFTVVQLRFKSECFLTSKPESCEQNRTHIWRTARLNFDRHFISRVSHVLIDGNVHRMDRVSYDWAHAKAFILMTEKQEIAISSILNEILPRTIGGIICGFLPCRFDWFVDQLITMIDRIVM